MELLGLPIGLCIGGVVLILALGGGLLTLVKLGVFAQYLLKEEPPDHGVYDLDQSQESGES